MSSQDDSGSFVTFGTPLKPIDDDEIARKKPIPIEDQIVTDENGRRRFHGAFTGGFSAGYYNTAGSRDGWSPAHFKSSRNVRNDSKNEQKPTDFMDSEDMGSFGFAPQSLQTSVQFKKPVQGAKDLQSNQRKRKAEDEPGQAIPGEPVLDQFLKPVTDTIGTLLLRKMGWKPGQGVGPRITRKSKQSIKKANERMFSSGKNKEQEQNEEEEEFLEQYKQFLFAPDDVEDMLTNTKDNLFGIGYSGLDRSSVLSSGHINLFEPSLSIRDKQNKSVKIRGQAFGVGAYEEEDEDIYGKDDMSRYDFTLDSSTLALEGPRKGGARQSRWDKKVDEDLDKIIEGFVKATMSGSSAKKNFPPPKLPKNFVPKCKKRESRFSKTEDDQRRPKTSNPTPRERQLILKVGNENNEMTKGIESDEQLKKLMSTNIEQTAVEMSSFQPFSRDEEKQARYEKYLVCVKNNRRDALPLLQPSKMTEWEREKERVEFERASMLYKPLVGSMNSKFVSAGSSEDVSSQKIGQVDSETVKDAKNAAKFKMYGKLTREKEEWHPANVLCVRFNVKHPYGDHSVVGVRKKRTDANFKLFETSETTNNASNNESQGVTTVITQTLDEDGKLVESKHTESDRDRQKVEEPIVEVQKPSMDLFKSIFLDSSSDSENEEEEMDVSKEAKTIPTMSKPEPAASTSKVPPAAVAKGIFANINFDALNKPQKTVQPSKPVSELPKKTELNIDKRKEVEKTKCNLQKKGTNDEEDVFGPAKPDTSSANMPDKILFVPRHVPKAKVVDSSEESDEWEEKTSSTDRNSSKKKNKKSKKLKKEKKSKKKKSRKKKHKKNKSSSEVSSDDD